ncbi:MAG: rhombosortase [Planctomycetota bacterium]
MTRSVLPAAALACACAIATAGVDLTELRLGPGFWSQPWRLFTAHLAHASATHFALDVGAGVALVLLGASLRSFLWLAPVVAIGVAGARPDLAAYVGLSGVLHGWFAQVAMKRAPWLLLVVGAKVAHELLTGGTTMAALPIGAAPVPEAHAIGLLAGCLGAMEQLRSTGARRKAMAPRSSRASGSDLAEDTSRPGWQRHATR